MTTPSNPWLIDDENRNQAPDSSWSAPHAGVAQENVDNFQPDGKLRAVKEVSSSASSPSELISDDESQELSAILGAGTRFEGKLSFAGRVRIDGEFSGELLGGSLLTIGDGARVSGQITAERVVILGGIVKADISATDSIELYVPANVTGDLKAPSIHLERGVRFHGGCDLSEAPLE